MSEGQRVDRLRFGAFVVCAWIVLALAGTPAIYLGEVGSGRSASVSFVFLVALLRYVPWMIVTPIIFWLAERFPISEPRPVRHFLIHASAGVLLLPLLTCSGVWLSALLARQPFSLDMVPVSSMVIIAFYSVPTYVAVAGIGHALAYFGRYRTRERLLARAELRALEAQLNPHFLFNALNAISAIGYRDPALADRALSQLSDLLRVTLDARPQEIPLRDELGFIQGYLDLCSIIMPGQVSFDLSVDQSTWNAQVPTMLLQPLIENAIVHGVAKSNGGGRLSLTTSRVSDRLRVVVGNDTPPARRSPGTGIGLANLRERLRVLHGEAATLAMNHVGQQVIVVVELPYRESVH
jgi:two-component system, LytTR family, sensor histidine kinase AlgZ